MILSQYILNRYLQEAFLPILCIFLLKKDLIIRPATFLLKGQPFLDQLYLLLTRFRIQLDELTLLVVVLQRFASFEVHSAIGPKAFLEEHVAVDSVVGGYKTWMVFVDVLFGWYKGQFRHLETCLITGSTMPVPLCLLTPLHCLFQVPILIDALIADLLEAVDRLLLVPARTSHFIIKIVIKQTAIISRPEKEQEEEGEEKVGFGGG